MDANQFFQLEYRSPRGDFHADDMLHLLQDADAPPRHVEPGVGWAPMRPDLGSTKGLVVAIVVVLVSLFVSRGEPARKEAVVVAVGVPAASAAEIAY